MTHAVFLEPVDAWSFRDGKPFEVGEAFEARSLFPPYPRTVLGCLRTAVLRRWCPEPERYAGRVRAGACSACGTGPCLALPHVGPPDGGPPFEIGPPLLARREGRRVQVYYPVPRDLVRLDSGIGCGPGGDPAAGRVGLLAPLDLPPGAAHCLDGLRPVGIVGPDRVEEIETRFVSQRALEAYLSGVCPEEKALADRPPTSFREPRIGIGIDAATRSARRGYLYLRDVMRLEERAGLLVATNQDLELDGAVARLGGDGRMTRVVAVDFPGWPSRPEVGVRFKVYLSAPTWFGRPGNGAGSWCPGWLDDGRHEGTPPGCSARVRLIGAAIGPLVPAGGWDLSRQQPRDIQWLVPAGAVYFFEAADGEQARLAAEALHGRALCDDAAMARAGFGLAFVGRW
ncbi:MAG TPA: type III-B CRISPR module-associated Cmr3 family protein [Thermodesulfobacteriota bacterium]|nr:type III-B CRISPR module-associated Cmr3 family protein [Thermodesulfobacteriota bacterium]